MTAVDSGTDVSGIAEIPTGCLCRWYMIVSAVYPHGWRRRPFTIDGYAACPVHVDSRPKPVRP